VCSLSAGPNSFRRSCERATAGQASLEAGDGLGSRQGYSMVSMLTPRGLPPTRDPLGGCQAGVHPRLTPFLLEGQRSIATLPREGLSVWRGPLLPRGLSLPAVRRCTPRWGLNVRKGFSTPWQQGGDCTALSKRPRRRVDPGAWVLQAGATSRRTAVPEESECAPKEM
jgi:hypothetical protein